MFFCGNMNKLRELQEDKTNTALRTIKNTPKELYNCGGYALKTFNWLSFNIPCRGNSSIKKKNATLKLLIQELLEDFPTLRLIKKLSDIQSNEYPIVMRVSENDFHFMCRGKNNQWYNKMGFSSPIHKVKQEKVFSKAWNTGWECYDSKIALFAKKWD